MDYTEQDEKRIVIHKLFIGTFETEIGKRCLEHLEATYVDRSMYLPGSTLEATAYRQGMADLIKSIKKEVTRNG